MTEPTPRPWNIVDRTTEGKTGNAGYIEIRGPNGEAICTLFPGAGKGGVGIKAARANAALIAAPLDLPNIKTKSDVLHVIKALSEHIGGFMEGDTAWVGEAWIYLDRAADVIEGKAIHERE